MLINVHLSKDVVKETSHAQAHFQAGALQDEIHRLLHRHGVLNFLSRDEAVALIDSLKTSSLQPKELKAWQELLVYLKSKNRLAAADPALLVGGVEGAQSTKDLGALQPLSPLVSIVGSEVYERLFPGDEVGVTKVGGTEVVATGAISGSTQVAQLQDLLDKGVFLKGTSRDEVFNALFAPLARVSQEIAVFDRYLYASLGDGGGEEHLGWLVRRLDEVARPGAIIKLFGARGIDGQWGYRVPRDGWEAKRLLEDNLRPNLQRAAQVEAWLAPSTRDMHHDRHIRFFAGGAVELPSGFDRFAAPRLQDNMGFTYRHVPESLRDLQVRERQVSEDRRSVSVRL